MRTVLQVFCITSMLMIAAAATGGDSVDRVRAIYQEAVANPGDDAKLDAYLATLRQSPRGSGIYIVEGDIGMSRDAIRSYLALKNNPGDVSRVRSKELIVNIAGGRYDYWATPGSRRLTYAFDRRTFRSPDELAFARAHLATASADWVSACPKCGIEIRELTDAQVAVNTRPTFNVAFLDEDEIIAQSFFPSDPVERRILYVYPQFFMATGFDPAGVMRHELGHVLGYRHEHIVNIPGCATEGGRWEMITPYTANSVMHYFCGNRGSWDLALRRTDIEGHRCLYTTGRPCADVK